MGRIYSNHRKTVTICYDYFCQLGSHLFHLSGTAEHEVISKWCDVFLLSEQDISQQMVHRWHSLEAALIATIIMVHLRGHL